MNALGDWLGIIGGTAGFIVLIASLIVAAKGSYNKARIQGLREDLDDSRNREEDREREVKDLQAKQEVCTAQIEGVMRENEVLKDLVTQRVEITVLRTQLESHHHEAMSAWTKLHRDLQHLQAITLNKQGRSREDLNE